MVDFVDTRYGPNGGSREWKGSVEDRVSFCFLVAASSFSSLDTNYFALALRLIKSSAKFKPFRRVDGWEGSDPIIQRDFSGIRGEKSARYLRNGGS